MDRTEKTALGVAVAGHVILFGLLSVGFLSTPNPAKLEPTPISVSMVDEVGMEATAPTTTPPAESVAPELGTPEDAAPAAASEVAPEPLPPTQPAPQPDPAPAAKPAPQPKPQPRKPAPAPEKAKPSPPKREVAPKAKPATKPAKSSGSDAASNKPRPRGSRLGDDFLKGIADQPTKSTSTTPSAARVDARALAGIQDAIRRQIQPCADRQVDPGPGANQIVTVLNLRLNRDGTLAATPRVVRQEGVDGDNGRYSRRVIDLGIAAFKGCSPLKLPQEFYQTSNGGWSNINYNWQLR